MNKTPPHIALIRRSYRPDGGAERIINRTLDGLRQYSDMDVSLICEHWQGSNDIHHITVPGHGFGRTAKHRNFISQVSSILSSRAFDLIQSNERVPGCTLYRAGDGVHAQWLERRATVIPSWRRQWLKISRFHRYMLRVERDMFMHPQLRCVICNSNMVKSDIQRHYPIDPQKLRIIYNGIDLQRFTPTHNSQERSRLRNNLGLTSAPLLLFVGSGFERKGLGQLIRALADSGSGWHLAVIGRDRHQARYQKQVASLGLAQRVNFVGVTDNVVPYYQCADLLVHPCLYDPFCNVVLEAMACGIGVVTNQYNGADEIIRDDNNGLHYDGDDCNTLNHALEKAFTRFDEYRENARTTAENHSIERMVEEIISLYRELLGLPDQETFA